MFRFRLITLLAVMTLIALSAGAFGIYRRAALAEDRALSNAGQKGALVTVYDGGTSILFLDPKAPPVGLCGTGLIRTYGRTGSPTDFTDRDLVLLDDVRNLNYVDFKLTSVSSSAAQEFQRRHPSCRVDF